MEDAAANPRPGQVGPDQALDEELLHLFGHLVPSPLRPERHAAWVREHLDTAGVDAPTALCLSGGGIRSATFALGVLQGLAANGRLTQFHYLSLVSGGGYIGSWLSSWIRRAGSIAHVQQALSLSRSSGSDDPASLPIQRLRAFSNYMSPATGLSADLFTLVAIYLRNLALHWLLFAPVLALAVLLPRLHIAALALDGQNLAVVATCAASALLVLAIAYITADLPPAADGADPPRQSFGVWSYLPLLGAALLFSWAGWWASDSAGRVHLLDAMLYGVVVHLLGIVAGLFWRWWAGRPLRTDGGTGSRVAGVLASGALGGLLLAQGSNTLRSMPLLDDDLRLAYATFAVPLLLGCFFLTVSAYTGLVRNATNEADREWWARASAWWLRGTLSWVALFALVVYLPVWLMGQLQTTWPAGAQVGVGGGVLGLFTALAGYWSKNGASVGKRVQSLASRLRVRVLDVAALAVALLALTGLSFAVSSTLAWSDPALAAQVDFIERQAQLAAKDNGPAALQGLAYRHLLLNTGLGMLLAGAALLLALALLAARRFGANTFSLHAMYGNRLVRAYLGATRGMTKGDERRPHPFTGFDPTDSLPLSQLDQATVPSAQRRLLPVLNMAVNLTRVADSRLSWQQRKAASFTATPLHCGSASLGYVRTGFYSSPFHGGMSLARAMTISGAAASPNMGYHSSPLVAFVMTLFNLRLGWWLPNPAPAWWREWQRDEPRNGGLASLAEALALTDAESPSVYLSDGGHFENLGLYEMVRRRCQRILVVDASCDPKLGHADLHNALRKVRVDFGVRIEFERALPGIGGSCRWTQAKIHYPAVDGRSARVGMLYCLKPMLCGREPLDVLAYAEQSAKTDNPFPHQATSDQFFDETQFESYRLLGLHSIEETKFDEQGWPLLPEAPTQDKPAALPASPPAAAASTGLLESIGSIGTAAVLASALTAGGVLGVTGALTLNTEQGIGLKAEDRKLLERGLPIELRWGTGEAERVQAIVIALGRVADQLVAVAAQVTHVQNTDSTTLASRVTNLSLDLRRAAQNTRELPGIDLEPLLKRLEQIRDRIGEAPVAADKQADASGLARQLREIHGELAQLRAATAALNPRRNIRGSSEGNPP